MHRDEVIAKLKQAEPALRGFGVAALYLFGSYARDEAESGSDGRAGLISGRVTNIFTIYNNYYTIRMSVHQLTSRKQFRPDLPTCQENNKLYN